MGLFNYTKQQLIVNWRNNGVKYQLQHNFLSAKNTNFPNYPLRKIIKKILNHIVSYELQHHDRELSIPLKLNSHQNLDIRNRILMGSFRI